MYDLSKRTDLTPPVHHFQFRGFCEVLSDYDGEGRVRVSGSSHLSKTPRLSSMMESYAEECKTGKSEIVTGFVRVYDKSSGDGS